MCIGESGDLLLFGFVSGYGGAMLGPGHFMLFLPVQVSRIGVLEGVPGALMPGQVIFFSVMLGGGAMGVRSKVALLRGDLL